MRALVAALFVSPLLACIDFERLYPAEPELGAPVDQSVVVVEDLAAPDLSRTEAGVVDAGPFAMCAAHLHDGVWTPAPPPALGINSIASLWADAGSKTLVAAYSSILDRSTDDTYMNGWMNPKLGGFGTVGIAAIAGTSRDRICYVNGSETNGHLRCVDLTGYPLTPLDLSSPDNGFVDQTPTLMAGSVSLIVAQPGTGAILIGGNGVSLAGTTVLVAGGNATIGTPATTTVVLALAASETTFWRGGYRMLDFSANGVNWMPLYTLGGTDPLNTALANYLGTSPPISAGVVALWTGRLATGEEMIVAAMTARDSVPGQTMCWRRGAGPAWRCQLVPFVPVAIWGTGCGVILGVGAHFQALRYDPLADKFELDTQTPPFAADTDAFKLVAGHADGTAFVSTNTGLLYRRD